MIPCEPLKTILEDYGINWYIPDTNGENYSNLNWKNWTSFDDNDRPYSIRYYDSDGNLNKEKSLDMLNSQRNRIKLSDIYDNE